MNVQEYIIGFDIRYECETEYIWNVIKHDFPQVTSPRSYDNYAWPSRFRAALQKDPPYDPVKTNFRSPSRYDDAGKYIVYGEMSETYYWYDLWTNLGDMLLYNPLNLDVDTVAAFTLVSFTGTAIACKGDPFMFIEDLASTVSMMESFPKTPAKLHPDEWQFLGYETMWNGMSGGLFCQGIGFYNGLPIKSHRNKYGLVESFDEILDECRIINEADPQHCPYFIFGVYEAIDVSKLSLT